MLDAKLFLLSYDRGAEERKTPVEERPKEDKTKKLKKKKRDVKDDERSSIPETKKDVKSGKKLKAEDQIYRAAFADYQRKQRLLKKQKSPSSSSSDSSDEEQSPGRFGSLSLFIERIFKSVH